MCFEVNCDRAEHTLKQTHSEIKNGLAISHIFTFCKWVWRHSVRHGGRWQFGQREAGRQLSLMNDEASCFSRWFLQGPPAPPAPP